MFQVTFCKLGDNARLTLFPTLFFLALVLLGLNSCNAQEFEQKIVAGLYSNNDFVDNLTPDQAILSFKMIPHGGGITPTTIFSYQDIRKGVLDVSKYTSSAATGRFYVVDNVRYEISLIDAKYLYVQTDTQSTTKFVIPALQEQLEGVGLGTVQARRNYISMISGAFVTPYDFRSYLQPWIVLGLVIAILIPAWYLMRRFLR